MPSAWSAKAVSLVKNGHIKDLSHGMPARENGRDKYTDEGEGRNFEDARTL